MQMICQMKYIKFFFVVGLLCSFLDSASAQRLVVFSVSGGPQLVTTNGNTSIKAYDELTMESTVTIPYDASLELLDETAKKHYVLKTPGRDKISTFVQNKKNGVGELSKRYFQYMQNQLKGGAKLAARRHSDPATVTREKQEYVEEDDWVKEFRDFTDDAREEYKEFRDQANKEYAEFMEEAWQSFRSQPAIPEPKKEEVKPLTLPQKERGKGIKSRPIQVEEFVAPLLVTPQPMPIDPAVLTIPEDVVVVDPYLPTVPMVITDPTISVAPIERLKIDPAKPQKPEGKEILYYGTKVYVRFEDECNFKLSGISEKDVAEGWETLSSEIYNNTIADCLSIRKQLRLSDWGYLQLLQAVGDACLGKGTNEATLLTAFIYCQSGYKMRLGRSDSQLVLLYGSRHIIYNKSYFTFNSDMFYALNSSEQQLMICMLPYPAEQGLSLLLTQEPILTDVRSDLRTLKSLNQPDLQAEVSVNKNLLDFYSNYPSSEIGGNMMSRWAMYANTPLDFKIKEQLYPALQKKIQGLGQKDAVGKLLDFVQWALVYKYDEEIWGGDRAFFAEETLFYPYADCEDRSILFSRLVRDLVGLKVVLVYYPGHLASAVHFTEPVDGDYLYCDGERFVICDATYFGAPVGKTMPDMDNKTAKAILLQ